MTTVYFRTISGTNFRDVRFLQPHEDGMIAGLPDWNDNDDEDNETADNGEPPPRPSSTRPTKRVKMMMPWNDDKGIFIWFDWKLLRDRDDQYWIDMFQHIVRLAPNLEVCVLHAVPVSEQQQQQQQPSLFNSSATSMPVGLPIKATTKLLRGMPKIKKFDLRNLNFVGSNADDFAAFQNVLENYCPQLEELYYYGPPNTSSTENEMAENEQKTRFANCLLSAKAPSTLKRLSMEGVELSKFNAPAIRNIGIGMTNLEFLKLQVQPDWEVLMDLAAAVKSLTKLTHFSLQIGKRNEGATSSLASSSVEEVAIQNSNQLLTEALSTHRFFVLELQVHSSLLATEDESINPSSSSNCRFLQPWVDLLKNNYSCHQFSLTTVILDDDDANETIYDPNHVPPSYNSSNPTSDAAIGAVRKANQDAEVYIALNKKRRNPFLSHFEPGLFGSTSCESLVTTMEGLGGTDSTTSSRGQRTVLPEDDEEEDKDVLTGLYHFVRENVGEVTALLLTNGNGNNKKKNSSGSGSGGVDCCEAAKPVVDASSPAKSSLWDNEDDAKMPASKVASSSSPVPTSKMGVAMKPSGLSAPSVTDSPRRKDLSSEDVEMVDDAATLVPPPAASPTNPAASQPNDSGDANNNYTGNGGIVDTTTPTIPAALALPLLTDWDVTLGRRRSGFTNTKPPTTATTCWINIVRGSRQHFPTAQNCLDAHQKLVFLATKGSGGGEDDNDDDHGVIRFYIALIQAYNNRHWVEDWNDQRTDGEIVFVRANDVAVKYDIDSNDLRATMKKAPATKGKSSSSGKSTKAPLSVKEITAAQRSRAVKEGKYATCLIELAGKEKASTTLWSELAKAKQSYADNGGVTDEEVDEYAGWVDVLARDYTDRASNMSMLTEVKQSLDDTLSSAKSS